MEHTKKITLAKALKLKNKLIHEIKKLKNQLEEENSTLEENFVLIKSRSDFKIKMEGLKQKTNSLILIKTLISKANAKIVDKIFELSELKGYISWLSGLDTTSGFQANNSFSGNGEKSEYVSCISKEDVIKMINSIEDKIEKFQDEIDTFNNTKRIEWDV